MEAMRELAIGPRSPSEPRPTFHLPPTAKLDTTLCETCRRLDIQAIVTQTRQYEYADLGFYTDIKSKSSHCRFCRLVVAVIISGWSSIIDWESCSNLHLVECGLDVVLRVQVYPFPPEAAEAKVRRGLVERSVIDVLAEDMGRIGLDKMFHTRVVQKEVADVAMMKEWISICERFHGETCVKEIAANVKQCPKSLRVIDVEDMKLTPVLTRSLWSRKVTMKRYVALSYIWGNISSVDSYKTTTANFKARSAVDGLRNVPFPRSIQDAIITTRRLGERYLWVDAACIIQDSDSDKAAQIRSMNIVYGAAYLTLVSAGGTDAECPLPRSHPGSPHPVNQLITEISGFKTAHPIPRLKEIETTPTITPKWFSRGWTYQERQLSTRLIIFTPLQVYFQCRIAGCCEDLLTEQYTSEPRGIPGLPTGNNFRQCSDGTVTRFMPTYKSFVQEYSTRNLGFDSDALNAFMGVGIVFTELHGERYQLYYGLPGPLLEEALTWQPLSAEEMVRRSEFPSWSWAGWRGGIKYSSTPTNWMLLDGSREVQEHVIDKFELHTKESGKITLPGPLPKDRRRVRDGEWRGDDGPQQKPWAHLPPKPGKIVNGHLRPKKLMPGTLEFVAVVAPESAFNLIRGDCHLPGCHCFTNGSKRTPLLAKEIATMFDKDGAACGTMGGGVFCRDNGDSDSSNNNNTSSNGGGTGKRRRAYVCLARSETMGAYPSCPGFDTRKYQNSLACCWEVLLVEYNDDGIAERVAAGRVHEDAWIKAEGLRWEKVWLR